MNHNSAQFMHGYHLELLDLNTLKILPGYFYIKNLQSVYRWTNLRLSKAAIGIETTDAIAGGTDLDFHWKLYGVQMRKNDQEVLKSKQAFYKMEISQRSDGIVHRLISYKMPLYENGDLSGILGISYEQPTTQFHLLLTPREQTCVALMTQGLTDKQIASHLRISPRTVETHLNSSKIKLNVHSRAELIVLFCKN